jgi:hypothetical protein
LRCVLTSLVPSIPSGSHYSLESTSLATAALDDDEVSGFGSGPGPPSPFSFFNVLLLQIMNQ